MPARTIEPSVSTFQVLAPMPVPAGVVSVAGEFERGQTVRIFSSDGPEIARGLAQYSAGDLERIKGLRSSQIAERLGYDYGPEVVHRDDMVLL